MFATWRKAMQLLSARERRQGALVLAMVMVMAVVEMAGVASVMPFLAVLGNPDLVETNPVLATLYSALGFTDTQTFLFALGIAAFCLVIGAAAVRTVTLYLIYRFTQMRRHSVGQKLLETYLRQPYAFFLQRHTGDLAKGILSEVDQLVEFVFRPAFEVIAYAVVVLAIVTLLVIVDPWLALVVATVIGGLYGLTFLVIKGLLSHIGRDRARANQERFTIASEALGGIKSIKLLGRERAYLDRFRGPSVRQARHQATSRILVDVPKYIVEAVGFGGVILLTLFLMATGGGLGEILPILGLYAFAGYRMMPAAQRIYGGIAKLRFGAAAVEGVHRDLYQRASLAALPQREPPAMAPREQIHLRDLSFHYEGAEAPALEHIDLVIPVGSSVGLVGSTGAGKTTLVDVLLGLLRPDRGALVVDDVEIDDERLRAWQRALGYVPQDIFLTDASVAENIALGVPADEVDHEQVKACARMAQVHDFVVGELPAGYATQVGERGVRLSGGQRQRLGIARALYHDPPVIVFDEATSALDNATEAAVMEAVDRLSTSKTIIMIAHRLTTVAGCDKIVLLDGGRIVDQGTASDLAARSAYFRQLSAAADP